MKQKAQNDWFQSKETINVSYLVEFMSAIENGTNLPVLTEHHGAIAREASTSMGVDLSNEQLFC